MSDDQKGAMAAATGDVAFVEWMIIHHEGAIEAAEDVLDAGATGEVRRLAEPVIGAQRGEVEQMTAWLEEWD